MYKYIYVLESPLAPMNEYSFINLKVHISDLVRICPWCEASLEPNEIAAIRFHPKRVSLDLCTILVLSFCGNCNAVFTVVYSTSINYWNQKFVPEGFLTTSYTLPKQVFRRESFTPEIQNISPKFILVYNQSQIAEYNNLTDLCGIGYLRSLEYLIKDYAIHRFPRDESMILDMPLIDCIDEYIFDNKIKNLIRKSLLIYDDINIYTEGDIQKRYCDIKLIIQATANYINSELVFEKAQAIFYN